MTAFVTPASTLSFDLITPAPSGVTFLTQALEKPLPATTIQKAGFQRKKNALALYSM